MLTDNESVTLILGYAKRVAFSMSQDPEMESIAGSAAWRAARTYKVHKGSLKRWIARCVRTQVWCYWRAQRIRKAEQASDLTLEAVSAPEAEAPLSISYFDYKLLHEHYVERIPLDVMARRYSTNKRGMRKLLNVSIVRLVDAFAQDPVPLH